MEQVAKSKRTWNLAPVLQIVPKIPSNYCPCFISIYWPQVWWLYLWVVVQKIYSTVYSVLYANTQHDATDLVNYGMVKNRKTWISWEWNINFLWNKKILNLCLMWHILRSYHFVANVTYIFYISIINHLCRHVWIFW